MRRAARTDDNQQRVIDALRQCGATVCDLSAVGEGCPDLLVGINRRNYLLEVKDGDKPQSRQNLTPAQHVWHVKWNGQVCVVRNAEEAVAALNPRK
jgi:hypothetical protein